jgi:hypothetical protein
MVVIEKSMIDGVFSGRIIGPKVTYMCNWDLNEDENSFEIDEQTFYEKLDLIDQGLPFEFATIGIELPDYMWLELAMGAHAKDMTLNKYVEYILRLAIDNQ